MKTVKVNLSSSYGYRDPVTGQRKYYGPGKGIEVPAGLANTLGLEVIGEEEADTGTELHEDFPGWLQLVEAGYYTIEAVREIDDLTAIDGIGPATATKIKEALSDF
jgi:hypothetical protein